MSRTLLLEERGVCRLMDRDLFFPGQGGDYTRARAACRVCPVRGECLESALAEEGTTHRDELAGIRGGRTAAERHRIRKFRSRADVLFAELRASA